MKAALYSLEKGSGQSLDLDDSESDVSMHSAAMGWKCPQHGDQY